MQWVLCESAIRCGGIDLTENATYVSWRTPIKWIKFELAWRRAVRQTLEDEA